MSTPITEPLPPVIELGRSLAVLEADYLLLDETTAARSPTQPEEQRMNLLYRQQDTLRELISTIPAATMADAAAQIGVACVLTSQLEASDWRQPEHQDRRRRLMEAVHRITLSALPVVAKAAGLDMNTMGWSDVQRLRATWFGLEDGA